MRGFRGMYVEMYLPYNLSRQTRRLLTNMVLLVSYLFGSSARYPTAGYSPEPARAHLFCRFRQGLQWGRARGHWAFGVQS